MNKEVNINNALVNQKSYALLEHNENLLETADISFSVDVPENKAIAIAMRGEGTVRIYKNGVQAYEIDLDGTEKVWTDPCIAGEKAVYFIDNADSIAELDLHGNHITEFYVNRELPLRKLVIYDNELHQLDCSRLTNLQFLHMFDNPMCDNEKSMKNTISSLPNRTDAATGSVIFYPWFGLETLIEETTVVDENGDSYTKYVKYPYEPGEKGNFSHPVNPHYRWLYDEDGNYIFDEGLYAVVNRVRDENNNVISESIDYYLECKKQNPGDEKSPLILTRNDTIKNFRSLRIDDLEPLSLPKNWVFGSAIMYHSDWEKCPWDFRQNHVADMWETAEKGFGLTLGTMDELTLLFPGSKYLNVLSFEDCQATPEYCDYKDLGDTVVDAKTVKNATKGNYNIVNFLKGEHNHGDMILSVICGNGAPSGSAPAAAGDYTTVTTLDDNKNPYTFQSKYSGAADSQRFGYVPLCKLRLLDKFDGNMGMSAVAIMGKFASLADSGCDSITSSTGYEPNIPKGSSMKEQIIQSYIDKVTWRAKFHNYSINHILTVSTGNKGDGNVYTNDKPDEYLYDYCYGTNNPDVRTGEEVEGDTGVIYNYALNREKQVAPNIQNSPAAERAKLGTKDFMSQYGQFILTHKNVDVTASSAQKELVGRLSYVQGTSYSSPILNAMLMLLRIIYTKMIQVTMPEDTVENKAKKEEALGSFGKDSKFMNYVRAHWCDRLPHLMDAASGYGLVDILADPVENSYMDRQPAAGCTDRFQVGEPIRFVYDADATKDGFTLGYDREMFALTSENTLYPIRPTSETQSISLYSNSARAVVTDDLYDENYYKNTVSVPAVAENTELEIMPVETVENDSQNFTIFLLVDFLTAASDEKPWFIKVKKDGEHCLCLEASKGLRDANNNISFVGKRLVWSVMDGDDNLGDELVCYPLENYLSKYSKGVIAITNSKEGMVTYFNGNRCSFVPAEEFFSVLYDNVVLSDVEKSVYHYPRTFTHEEIIRNSAAILNTPQ